MLIFSLHTLLVKIYMRFKNTFLNPILPQMYRVQFIYLIYAVL